MTDPITPAARPAVPPAAGSSAQRTAKEFEAVFIGQLTKLMMGDGDEQSSFSGGHGEAMFRGVLAEKIGAAMAQRGGIGLAPAVLSQIIKMQGK